MKIAYADPPYIGQAKKHYSDDSACAEVDHVKLIHHLSTFDGWALSCSSPSLKQILPICPDNIRIGAWIKPFCSFKVNVNPAYAWEPILFSVARKRGRDLPTVRDYVSASPPVFTSRHRSTVHGEKPDEFCFWLFELLGMESDDEFVDLYPGSGAVTAAWAKWQQRLL